MRILILLAFLIWSGTASAQSPFSDLSLLSGNSVLLPVGTSAARPTGTNGMIRYNSTTAAVEAYANSGWIPISPAGGGTATPTIGTNVTSCVCATATCTNLRGSLTIVGGTATTGTICSLAWTATPTTYVCTATMNGGATVFGIGNSVATTTGMNITAGVSVATATLTVNYGCVP